MVAYDLRSRATAARALRPKAQGGKGQVITVVTKASGAIDPATDTRAPGSPVSRTGSGIVLEYTTFIRSGVKNEPGTMIRAGDKQLLLSALGVDGLPLSPPPQVDDVITLEDGVAKFTITSLAPLDPAGLQIYFDCNIRGSK